MQKKKQLKTKDMFAVVIVKVFLLSWFFPKELLSNLSSVDWLRKKKKGGGRSEHLEQLVC